MMNDRIYYSREAETRALRERNTMILIFLGLGVMIGAVIALLLAPRSGEALRGEIAEAVEQGIEDGRKASGDAISRLEKDFADLRKRVEERR